MFQDFTNEFADILAQISFLPGRAFDFFGEGSVAAPSRDSGKKVRNVFFSIFISEAPIS